MTEKIENGQAEIGSAIKGLSILSAKSSLKNFSLVLEGGVGLSIEALSDDDSQVLRCSIIDLANLPKMEEAVCSVDWSWIYRSKVDQISISERTIKFVLNPAGPLTISVAVWQGSPFLSFHPFRPPK